ncbi:Hypothetical predicted protein [Octopus vulgaris]|nr:Hypothetical predicted protein [Octopus vulgaris]
MTARSVNRIIMVSSCVLVVVLFAEVLPCVHGSGSSAPRAKDLPGTIEEVVENIYTYQAKRDSQTFLPFKWSHTKGIYESDVKLYFHGKPIMTYARDLFAVYDVNMFATTWINLALLEAYNFNKIAKPSAKNLEQSLEAISQFSDHNVDYSNSLMCFWPQEFNETTQIWESTPRNLIQLFKFADILPWNFIEDVLDVIGLHNFEEKIKDLLDMKKTLIQAFHIPPDFDDTFVNLALGAILTEMKADFPEQHKTWLQHNTNITSIFDALKKYAYRPFSGDEAVNSIDPRTYFYLRHFLEDAANKGRDVALVSTWVQNINESRKLVAKGVAMPFNVNNVDCAVAANTIFGITSGVLSGLIPATILDDPDIQKIYLNTSSMLQWQLRTRLSDRTDLALPYYPSLLEFYWFVSRTVSAVERVHLQGNIPHKALEEAYQLLSEAQRTATTEHILSLATRETTGVYFDGFIGDADNTNKAEDRLFTTSVAVNALQGIWTVYDDKSGKNIWIKETPQNVIETITSAVTFLQENILNNRYKPWNAFFSGSVKGLSTLPFLYPFNRFENSPSMVGQVRAMEGTISEEEYIAKTKEPVPMMGNMTTPMEFHGFNEDQSVFPFWTSEPYTYATTLLALSHFQNTEKKDA